MLLQKTKEVAEIRDSREKLGGEEEKARGTCCGGAWRVEAPATGEFFPEDEVSWGGAAAPAVFMRPSVLLEREEHRRAA